MRKPVKKTFLMENPFKKTTMDLLFPWNYAPPNSKEHEVTLFKGTIRSLGVTENCVIEEGGMGTTGYYNVTEHNSAIILSVSFLETKAKKRTVLHCTVGFLF